MNDEVILIRRFCSELLSKLGIKMGHEYTNRCRQ